MSKLSPLTSHAASFVTIIWMALFTVFVLYLTINQNPHSIIELQRMQYLSNASTSTHCERFLYYEGSRGRIGAGLDHHLSLFQRQFKDAAHYNFTHLIVENMSLSAVHNHGRHTINQSWWHYFDLDHLTEISNVKILNWNHSPLPIQKHIMRGTYSAFEINHICNYSVPFRECGLSVRMISGRFWWKTPKCLGNDQKVSRLLNNVWHKASTSVLQCVKDLELSDNDTCFIHAMIRRGDRFGQYTRKYKQLISSEGISKLCMYLAERFCGNYESIAFYLGTDGDDQYIEAVEKHIAALSQSNAKHFTLMTKQDLFSRDVKCAAELKENNYFLYQLEKEIGKNTDIMNVHFHFNPKYMGSTMFADEFKIKIRSHEAFIAFTDLEHILYSVM
eukprot:378419_1